MSLSIDLTRPVLSRDGRLALVQAVLDASVHEQETDYIEWKGFLDLQERRAILAKHILGFANRSVASAARHFAGMAYVVVGAEPGVLNGVIPADPADLHNWLSPFVGGQAGPQWDAHYVDVQSKQVLVIAVAAPRDGDRAWPLRREFNAPLDGHTVVLREGTFYIRRGGLTVEANAAEQDMLHQRATGRGNRTAVTVATRGDTATLTAIDLSPPSIESYLQEERARLLAALTKAQAAPAGSAVEHRMEVLRVGIGIVQPDPRTPDEYRGEVDTYIEALRAALPLHVRLQSMRRRLAVLCLDVSNLTDENFLGVQVEVHVPGSAKGLWPRDLPMRSKLPRRPDAYGPRTRNPWQDVLRGITMPVPDIRIPDLPDVAPRGRIRNNGSVTADFVPVDLRPEATEELEDLLLVIDSADAGRSLSVSWRATSTNAPGVSTGDFAMTVLPEAATVADLTAADPPEEERL